MERKIFILGCISFAVAVAIGAFGAHGLEESLTANDRLDTFNTGSKYHFYHSIGILILALASKSDKFDNKKLRTAAYLMLTGIVLFSFSLYILSVTNITALGIITPFGGLSFIAGWILAASSFKK